MNPWPFVTAAYAVTFIGTLVTSVWAWRTAKSAEARADVLRERD